MRAKLTESKGNFEIKNKIGYSLAAYNSRFMAPILDSQQCKEPDATSCGVRRAHKRHKPGHQLAQIHPPQIPPSLPSSAPELS